MTVFKRTTSSDSDFGDLVALLDADLMKRDGEEHHFYAQFNKTINIRNVIVGYVGIMPICCGAFKEYEINKAEIKRMFVVPEYRGHGIGFNILKELEIWAAELNYTECILETGKKQPQAIGLYHKAGYNIIENYGQYKGIENSLCMSKSIL